MKGKILTKIILTAVFLMIFAPIYPQETKIIEATQILRVIDGDTLEALYKGEVVRIRLIGIDAPESMENEKAINASLRNGEDIDVIIAMGKQSTAFVEGLLQENDTVSVEFDKKERDEYGRLLGYVFLQDRRMLNEEILKAGYADIVTFPPNTKYIKRLYGAYLDARENRRGFWNQED